jgi:HK97 family phage portal protein
MADTDTDRPSLLARLGAAISVLRATSPAPGGFRWLWPSGGGGFGGGGDRGPPGSWQMNTNQNRGTQELVAFSAVYACINTISSDISKLPAQIFGVDLDTRERTLRPLDYYAGLFRTPNHYQTYADFMHAFVQSFLFQGNTYCYCGKRNGRGEITEMHVLNPYRTKPLIADNGEIFYQCSEDFLAGLAPDAIVPERDMIHHRLPLLPGFPLIGVTPVFAAAASSAVGLKILQNSQQFFANSSRPSGFLSAPGKVSEPTANRLAVEWDENYKGERYGKTALLPEGLKWEPVTITAQDAQLIEQLRWSVEDVARVFRVPPFMLGDMSKVTYRNVETLMRVYLNECLAYYIETIEERFERAFDFPPTFQVKLDLSQLLRVETDVRYTGYQTALNAGWLTVNEVRSQEGLGPVEGGDEPHVQQQMIPLSSADGTQANAAPAPAPTPSNDPAPSNDPPPPEPTKAVTAREIRTRLRERMREAA